MIVSNICIKQAVIERDSMVLKYNCMEKQCMDLQHKLKNMEGTDKKLFQTKTEFAVMEKKMDEYEKRVTQFAHENKSLQEKNELLQRNIGYEHVLIFPSVLD